MTREIRPADAHRHATRSVPRAGRDQERHQQNDRDGERGGDEKERRLDQGVPVATARRDVKIAAGEVPSGTIAAQRMQVSGLRNGRPLVTFSANWYLTTDVDPEWDLRETGWHVLVEGDTPLDVDIRFPVPPDDWAATSPGLTAHRPVNAIPFVCAAEPGIRTIVDLPQVVATLG